MGRDRKFYDGLRNIYLPELPTYVQYLYNVRTFYMSYAVKCFKISKFSKNLERTSYSYSTTLAYTVARK
jgi:hypothetical protein